MHRYCLTWWPLLSPVQHGTAGNLWDPGPQKPGYPNLSANATSLHCETLWNAKSPHNMSWESEKEGPPPRGCPRPGCLKEFMARIAGCHWTTSWSWSHPICCPLVTALWISELKGWAVWGRSSKVPTYPFNSRINKHVLRSPPSYGSVGARGMSAGQAAGSGKMIPLQSLVQYH